MLAEKVEVSHVTLFCLLQRDGGGRHGGFKAQPEKYHFAGRVILRQLQRVHRRINNTHIRAARFSLQQRTLFPRHAHGIAKGAENHLRMAGDFHATVDASHWQHADRTTGAVNKLHVFGQ
ncbi:Uncharacterised protein [Salmonella enterica subsp. enterica serovar Bovismorbificans]|nr:Uncharacterised protein [Salmonella enterica subsp. enterica serovar Bovismorbificans]